MARRAVYVEALIRADPEELWRLTQEPREHQRWDLRFTRIDPLPRPDPTGARRFRYAVRLLPGLTIGGTGVSAGERIKPDGSRTSALRFGSTHQLSLIRSGSGYWRYLPTPDGIRFLTGYDYQPGWGRLGRLADRVFRPLMGWGTAWSFDRLRLWLENGVTPETSLRRALADVGVRVGVMVATWGLTPTAAAVLIGAGCVLLPPMPSTPAARRCRRRPPDRRSATPPATLAALERP